MPRVMSANFYHCGRINLENMTVRAALAVIRRIGTAHFGSIGTASIMLDDCTSIVVELDNNGNTSQTHTQKIYRMDREDKNIRRYNW